MSSGLITFLVAVLLIVFFFVLWFSVFKIGSRRRLMKSFGMDLLLVKIPKSGPAENKGEDFKTEIGKFEQLLSALASAGGIFGMEIAVPHVGEEIHFYVSVSKKIHETAVRQIQGLWNGASVEEQKDDYNIFNPHGSTAAAYLEERSIFALPIRTYLELGGDSFSSILGGFANVREVGEGAALQIMMRVAPKENKKRIQSMIKMLKKGEPTKKVLGEEVFSISDIGEALNPKSEEQKNKEPKITDETAIRGLEEKLKKPLFSVRVRILASAASPLQSNDILEGIATGFGQFGAPERNEFRIVKVKNPKKIIRQFIFREFGSDGELVLSSEEIASFCHFPIFSTETPRVKWLKAKEAAPPANLPAKGILVGQSIFRGENRPVCISDDDRRRHLYTVGQTGTGKSTLLGNLIIGDIEAGKGVAVIDPHGDLAGSILAQIPKERLADVIYFDPSDIERPLGLNMLDYNFARPEEKTFIVNEMQSIFNKLFTAETMGPMFEQYMRNALLLLMEDMPNEPATLVEVPRVFTDVEYRKRKLARVRNPVVIDFWEKEAAKAGGEASLQNMTPYITSKFSNFISNDYVRPIIGQAKSAFNFRDVMDSGKILLINLSKGRIGDINAGLLGMVFTGKILMAALSRVDIPDQKARRDFYLYIDEFQSFTTDSISSILSEARKYGLSLTMAHQFIAQLTDKIRDAVFGNVGSMVVFRVGVADAEFLVKQFEPTFNQNDLLNIDNLQAYAKILINGETSKPFNLKIGTRSWQPGDKEMATQLKETSRSKYGMDRKTIEDEIYRRLRT